MDFRTFNLLRPAEKVVELLSDAYIVIAQSTIEMFMKFFICHFITNYKKSYFTKVSDEETFVNSFNHSAHTCS